MASGVQRVTIPPRFAVGEAWVKAESQHLYASTDELGQVFNFEFAEANWFADEFRTAIADGLRAAEETHGSTTTWVMNNHDVPRSPSRFGLPQVKDAPYHQLAHDWLLRDGETYRENRELGTRRARAAALMELGLPGSAYVYQGEELGLFEVANIPWDRLEDPTPFNTRRNFTDKGRDGCPCADAVEGCRLRRTGFVEPGLHHRRHVRFRPGAGRFRRRAPAAAGLVQGFRGRRRGR